MTCYGFRYHHRSPEQSRPVPDKMKLSNHSGYSPTYVTDCTLSKRKAIKEEENKMKSRAHFHAMIGKLVFWPSRNCTVSDCVLYLNHNLSKGGREGKKEGSHLIKSIFRIKSTQTKSSKDVHSYQRSVGSREATSYSPLI